MYINSSGHLTFSILLGIGTLVGAIVGSGVTLVTQLIENNGDFKKVERRLVIVDSVFGAIDGALSVTGMGALVSLAINPILAGAQSFVGDLVTGNLDSQSFARILLQWHLV